MQINSINNASLNFKGQVILKNSDSWEPLIKESVQNNATINEFAKMEKGDLYISLASKVEKEKGPFPEHYKGDIIYKLKFKKVPEKPNFLQRILTKFKSGKSLTTGYHSIVTLKKLWNVNVIFKVF